MTSSLPRPSRLERSRFSRSYSVRIRRTLSKEKLSTVLPEVDAAVVGDFASLALLKNFFCSDFIRLIYFSDLLVIL